MARSARRTITKRLAPLAVAALLALALAVGLVACTNQQETGEGLVTVVSESSTESTAVYVAAGAEGVVPMEEFSTFESKDPFIQQVVPTTAPSTTSTTAKSTTTSYTTTTRYYPTTTTWWTTTTTKPSTTTTTKPSTTTTTNPSTTTTKPPSTTTTYAHSLKIMSVDEIDNAPACTFKVDNTIYKDQRVGDVVSTSWGQIQVVDISLSSKVVTLLQGSETILLEEGQTIYG